MSRVEIYRLKKGGAQDIIAEFFLEGTDAVGKGDEKFIERVQREGILDKSTSPPSKIFPNSGEKFLQKLSGYFDSGYFIASEVIEDRRES